MGLPVSSLDVRAAQPRVRVQARRWALRWAEWMSLHCLRRRGWDATAAAGARTQDDAARQTPVSVLCVASFKPTGDSAMNDTLCVFVCRCGAFQACCGCEVEADEIFKIDVGKARLWNFGRPARRRCTPQGSPTPESRPCASVQALLTCLLCSTV